jgi:hypothetical protein
VPTTTADMGQLGEVTRAFEITSSRSPIAVSGGRRSIEEPGQWLIMQRRWEDNIA